MSTFLIKVISRGSNFKRIRTQIVSRCFCFYLGVVKGGSCGKNQRNHNDIESVHASVEYICLWRTILMLLNSISYNFKVESVLEERDTLRGKILLDDG